MSSISQLLGRLLIVCALIVVPFSMAHGSMGVGAVGHIEDHAIVHDSHADMKHGHHNHSEVETSSHSSHSQHEGHDSANCCPSICSGAISVFTDLTHCMPHSKQNFAFGSKFLEQGEWVSPFRPPST